MDLFQTAVCRSSRPLGYTVSAFREQSRVNECLCLVPFLLEAKILASGMVPPTVGGVSHLSEYNRDNPSTDLHAQTPFSGVILDLIKLTAKMNYHSYLS